MGIKIGTVIKPVMRRSFAISGAERTLASPLAPPDLGAADMAYIFSTSGLPSKPWGMNINTKTRMPNAATSLYSTEK